MANRNELKKALIAEGFEVYRTLPDRLVLADRVRDNLIMDSGVSVGFEGSLTVRFVVRAQQSDFVGEDDEALFDRARAMASNEHDSGYEEVATEIVVIQDPGDKSRTLDTWFEVAFERRIDSTELIHGELRRLMALEKTAPPVRHRQG
jgi:hypothetical protein